MKPGVYVGILDQKKIEFKLNLISGEDTNCGFRAFKISRNQFVNTLLDRSISAEDRQSLAQEVDEFISEKGSIEFIEAYVGRGILQEQHNALLKARQAKNERDLSNPPDEKKEEEYRNLLSSQEVYEAYVSCYRIDDFGYRLMMGFEAAKLYAKSNPQPVHLYLWKIDDKAKKKVKCIGKLEAKPDSESLHMFHRRKGTHYDTLEPISSFAPSLSSDKKDNKLEQKKENKKNDNKRNDTDRINKLEQDLKKPGDLKRGKGADLALQPSSRGSKKTPIPQSTPKGKTQEHASQSGIFNNEGLTAPALPFSKNADAQMKVKNKLKEEIEEISRELHSLEKLLATAREYFEKLEGSKKEDESDQKYRKLLEERIAVLKHIQWLNESSLNAAANFSDPDKESSENKESPDGNRDALSKSLIRVIALSGGSPLHISTQQTKQEFKLLKNEALNLLDQLYPQSTSKKHREAQTDLLSMQSKDSEQLKQWISDMKEELIKQRKTLNLGIG